jgi:hypothetical protein
MQGRCPVLVWRVHGRATCDERADLRARDENGVGEL